MTTTSEPTDPTRFHKVIISLAVVVLFAALTFLVVSRFVTRGAETRVAVIGDSLTAQSTWPIIEALNSHGYEATVAGENSATINDRLRQIESLTLPGSAEIVVIALGTNNAFFASVDDSRRRTLSDSQRDVHEAMSRAFEGERGQTWKPSTRCLVWVNVGDQSPMMGLDKNAPALNRAIEDEASDFTKRGEPVVVADWANLSRNHPEWFIGDKVHFTPQGEQAFAQLIRQAVQRCPT